MVDQFVVQHRAPELAVLAVELADLLHRDLLRLWLGSLAHRSEFISFAVARMLEANYVHSSSSLPKLLRSRSPSSTQERSNNECLEHLVQVHLLGLLEMLHEQAFGSNSFLSSCALATSDAASWTALYDTMKEEVFMRCANMSQPERDNRLQMQNDLNKLNTPAHVQKLSDYRIMKL